MKWVLGRSESGRGVRNIESGREASAMLYCYEASGVIHLAALELGTTSIDFCQSVALMEYPVSDMQVRGKEALQTCPRRD